MLPTLFLYLVFFGFLVFASFNLPEIRTDIIERGLNWINGTLLGCLILMIVISMSGMAMTILCTLQASRIIP